jgi:hypothetical protein
MDIYFEPEIIPIPSSKISISEAFIDSSEGNGKPHLFLATFIRNQITVWLYKANGFLHKKKSYLCSSNIKELLWSPNSKYYFIFLVFNARM